MGRGHLVQAVPVTGVDTRDMAPSGVGNVAEGPCQSKSSGWWRGRMDDSDPVKEG